jgi:hypothetical protein
MDYPMDEPVEVSADEPVEEQELTEVPPEPSEVQEPSEVPPEPSEVQEPSDLPLEAPPAPVPRIRKVRITAPAPTAPAQPPHVYWPSRLQEHRDAKRAEKDARYSNLRIY